VTDATEGIVSGLVSLSRIIDKINLSIGRAASWLIVAAVLVSSVNALIRKLFDTSSNAWLELQWVLFSAVFLLCASWALLANEHVRIDIVNTHLPRRVRNAIEIVGHVVFLLPLVVIMLVTSLPFFLASWRVNEQSASAGGLQQWPTKSLIFVGFALLQAQGVSELIKRIAIMRGLLPDPALSHSDSQTSAEAEAARLLANANKDSSR
jgi:TRAP-type mannitol/chloroaromatic compound transport system permease small subunit